MMDEELHSLAGAHALDALPADERAEFEAHVESCAACRQEVAEFRTVASELALLTVEAPPPALRSRVLDRVPPPAAAETVQWATRELLAARTREDVVDTVLAVVERLGGWTVPAADADDRALPLDVGLGGGTPLLPAAEPGSDARLALERHLPQLVEDARQALETIHRVERHAGATRPGDESGRPAR